MPVDDRPAPPPKSLARLRFVAIDDVGEWLESHGGFDVGLSLLRREIKTGSLSPAEIRLVREHLANIDAPASAPARRADATSATEQRWPAWAVAASLLGTVLATLMFLR